MKTTLLAVCATLLAACAAPQPQRAHHPTVNFAAEIPAELLPDVASCKGISDELKNKRLYDKKSDILAVKTLTTDRYVGARNKVQQPHGARIVIAASHGSNVPWIERVAQCQVDTYAASNQSAEDEPLSVPGARVAVKEVAGGYALDITSDSWDAAREIERRAERLR